MARNTYKERARKFFDNDERLAKKYEAYFNMENEILLTLADSKKYEADREVFIRIVEWNRQFQKKLSDTDGRGNLPYSGDAIELVKRLMGMRKGQTIRIQNKDDSDEEKELVTVQVIVKYKDGDEIKSKSIDQQGNGVVMEI
jgi:hypothetical protein